MIDLIYTPSLDLIVLVIALIADVTLAVMVYESNPKSATNRIFSLLTFFTMLWLLCTYTARVHDFNEYSLWIARFGIITAAPMSLLFFFLAHTIPSETVRLSKKYFWASIAGTFLMVGLNASPYAFTRVAEMGNAPQPVVGPGFIPFAILSTIFSALAIYWLVKKYRAATNEVEGKQLQLVLIGIAVMLALIITTLLAPIVIFSSAIFLPLTPLYTLAFLGLTAYAITKYQLFNIKTLLAQVLTSTICVVLFARIFGEQTMSARIIDALMLAFVVVFGFFLVRSVKREVQQREEIEQLSAEKSEFMTFASHEIRNPITAMRGYASLITDGTAGEAPPSVKEAAEKIFVLGDEVLTLIAEFLNKSKLELGQLSYHISEFDLSAAVVAVAKGYEPHLQQKGLTLKIDVDPAERIRIKADEARVKEVVGNLIDNSMKYTPHGEITVSVHRHGVHARVVVSDTGVGIPVGILPKLFQKFSRADAKKANILGTGIGLYLGKTFTEAMGGRIWAESEGRDRGSQFYLEFEAV